MAEKFNQNKYIQEYNKNHYKSFKVDLKKEEIQNINKLLKNNNLSKADFLRLSIKKYEIYEKRKELKKMNQLVVGIKEEKDYYKINYYIAKNKDEYYDGNDDVFATYTIMKKRMINPNDMNELKELIKEYDLDFQNKDVIFI